MNLPRDFELQRASLRCEIGLDVEAGLACCKATARCVNWRDSLFGLTCVFLGDIVVRLRLVLYELFIIGG
jgi:hypothetical protein